MASSLAAINWLWTVHYFLICILALTSRSFIGIIGTIKLLADIYSQTQRRILFEIRFDLKCMIHVKLHYLLTSEIAWVAFDSFFWPASTCLTFTCFWLVLHSKEFICLPAFQTSTSGMARGRGNAGIPVNFIVQFILPCCVVHTRLNIYHCCLFMLSLINGSLPCLLSPHQPRENNIYVNSKLNTIIHSIFCYLWCAHPSTDWLNVLPHT